MLEEIIIVISAISVFLVGVLAGMALVHKMYKKTIEEQKDTIEIQEKNNIRILNVNRKYSNIIDDVLNENDYASAEYIKNKIKEALDDASKQY